MRCLFIGLLCGIWACSFSSKTSPSAVIQERMRGLSFVAPPRAFDTNPMPPICKTGANWIAVIPYAYSRKGDVNVYYNMSQGQWWGERPEGAAVTVKKAHEAGLKTMLKPQVYVPGGWVGDMWFEEEADWVAWEAAYTRYILDFARMADSLQVGLFCVGTELKRSALGREAYWRGLIREVRRVYSGPLTYAANWDVCTEIPFWDALDYVGVDAYFPLDTAATPSVPALQAAWKPHQRVLRGLYAKAQRPILFTEYGYLSVDGCAYNTWELEGQVRQLAINERAQANAIEGLLSVFWEEPYWAGGFLWKWFPNMAGHEGYPERDYTPQGKMALPVLTKWYKQGDKR